MIKIKLLFLTFLLLWITTGCGNKQKKESIPEKKTNTNKHIKPEFNSSKKGESNYTQTATLPPNTHILTGIKGETYTITEEAGHFTIAPDTPPVILINLFSTWCPPCRGQIPYFEDLKKQFGPKLLIIGIVVNDDINDTALKQFDTIHHVRYLISNSPENRNITAPIIDALNLDANFTLPLTILYHNGNYYTHYEGAIPIEMIAHDIKNTLEDH